MRTTHPTLLNPSSQFQGSLTIFKSSWSNTFATDPSHPAAPGLSSSARPLSTWAACSPFRSPPANSPSFLFKPAFWCRAPRTFLVPWFILMLRTSKPSLRPVSVAEPSILDIGVNTAPSTPFIISRGMLRMAPSLTPWCGIWERPMTPSYTPLHQFHRHLGQHLRRKTNSLLRGVGHPHRPRPCPR